MLATDKTLAPAAIAFEAAVCRRSCGVTGGIPDAIIAGLNTLFVKFDDDKGLPKLFENT